ncbi:MAG: lipid II:glycine glycyltransferase FemX [Candidatus Hodarchaeota archaeon]
MKIVREVDRVKWADFVYNHPNGNIFQTPEMYEVYKNTKNYEPNFLAVVNEDDEISGVLLSVVQRENIRPISRLTERSIIWGGPLIKDEDTKVFTLILGEYEKIAKKRAVYSQFRNLFDMQKFSKIFYHFGYSFENHLNIIIDLKKSEEVLWKEIHCERRHNIRRALNKGTFVEEIKNFSDLLRIYHIICQVYNNAKLPIADKSLFEGAVRILSPHGMVKCFGAFYCNEIIGVRFVLSYKKSLYDWYAGSKREFRNKYPNDLLPWEIFKWGILHGYEVFDFGGAGKPNKPYGVREYKRKFGGKFIESGRYVKEHKPILMQISKVGFKIIKKLNI